VAIETIFSHCLCASWKFVTIGGDSPDKKSKDMAVNKRLFTVAAAVAAIGAFYRFESHRHPSTKTGTDTDFRHVSIYHCAFIIFGGRNCCHAYLGIVFLTMVIWF
jgi:hypothetical protein